jgi:hypothetical protein
MLEEGADRGKPVVAARSLIPPLCLQVREEGLNRIDVKVTELQVRQIPPVSFGDEREEQAQRIPICADGMGAHSAHPLKILAEERLNER